MGRRYAAEAEGRAAPMSKNQSHAEDLRVLHAYRARKALAKEIVDTVIADLDGRAGFDEWYHVIEPEIQEEIHYSLERKVLWLLEGQS